MKALVTNNRFMAALSFGLLLIGLAVSLLQKDFTWLARSGAVLVGLGIVVLSRTSISGTELHIPVLGAETGLDLFTPEHHIKLGNPVPEWVYEQQRNRFALGKLGPALSFVGTVIWGFGDLLNKMV